MTCDVLVIGWGNLLRRDDAIGLEVARALSTRVRVGVCIMELQQLTPELSALVAGAKLSVFVDAREGAGGVALDRLEPVATNSALVHAADPRALLALAQAVYGRSSEAWLVTVPGSDFGIGEGLSDAARDGVEQATERILERFGIGKADATKRAAIAG